MMTSNTIADMM